MMKEQISKIKAEIGDTQLAAVSKRKPVSKIKAAVKAGIRIIAENRIQEAEKKYAELKDFFNEHDVEFHFIGHLQSNKAKQAVEMFDLIQTIDSEKIAEEIDKRAASINKVQDVLVQINIGKESQKYGIMPENTIKFIKKISALKTLSIRGLMCMPPFGEDPRPFFRKMKQLFEECSAKLDQSSKTAGLFNILSMGMSSDYKIAIEEGSTMVRIGTKIFGKRD